MKHSLRCFSLLILLATALLPITGGICMPELMQDVRVPVLMYHCVSDHLWGSKDLFTSPASMEAQLAYLSQNGYTTITFEDFPRLGKIEKPVMLTFDDGYRDNYENLFPLLQKYGAKATIFLITDTLSHHLYLDREMIREMAESGLVSFQSHTVHHYRMDTLSDAALHAELCESARTVEELTDCVPLAICYPYGRYSSRVTDAAAQYYDYGVCIEGKAWDTVADTMRVTRLTIHRTTSLSQFAALLS